MLSHTTLVLAEAALAKDIDQFRRTEMAAYALCGGQAPEALMRNAAAHQQALQHARMEVIKLLEQSQSARESL